MMRTRTPDLQLAIAVLLTRWLHAPGKSYPPDADTMVRAARLECMLGRRMEDLRRQGIDPTTMSIEELLPGVNPDELDVTVKDY